MTTLSIVSDWHIGAQRMAGATPLTAYQLRQALLTSAEEILYTVRSDLMVNGDLFDGADIPKADILRAVQIFNDWLVHTGKHLYLVNGNHDLSKTSTTFSAFQLLAALLVEMHGPERVTHIAEGTYLEEHDTYAVPHLPNQDLFDLALAKVPACRYLTVHANYDNEFAVESDHSLNISKAQAQALPVKHMIFGHVHQQSTALKGKVILVGNQFPSSIADCLGNAEKHMVELSPDAVKFIPTWHAAGDFSEQDWRDLKDEGRFIRIIGEATAAEADAVITAIARFRKDAKALVTTNAVKIAGVNDTDELALSQEAVTSFDVLKALLDILSPQEQAKVKALLENENVT
jgi:DNA repair exonuclease SbcCD nuclease subunit